MRDILQDLKYGFRMLAKSPGFTAVAVITLALGIGLNASIFSVVNAVLLRPMPVHNPDELVGAYNTAPGEFVSHVPMAYADYKDLRDSSQSFTGLLAYATVPVSTELQGATQILTGEMVSGNYFSVLGINSVLGRTFTQDEDSVPGRDLVAVISHAAWQRRYGSDPAIVGKTLRLNGVPFNIIGVARPGFPGMFRGINAEVWVPLMSSSVLRPAPTASDASAAADWMGRRSRWLWVVGRLKPGVTLAQANSEAATIGQRLMQEYPDTNKTRAIELLHSSAVRIFPGVDKALFATSFVLMAVVGLVLLIACANVANMMLARASARKREVAVRLSLGAGRGRLIRQLLTENLMLALVGGGAGLLLAAWSNSAINGLRLPIPINIGFNLANDWRVVAFTFLACVGATVFFGLAPALQASKTDLVTALKEESRTGGAARGRLRSVLVVAQVALSLILLIGAALSVRSMWNAHLVNPGFESKGLVQAQFTPSLQGYTPEREEIFFRELKQRVQAIPGVESVTYASHLPLEFSIRLSSMAAEGQDAVEVEKWPQIDTATVAPGYFETMRIGLVKGRTFAETDAKQSAKVAVINETLAARFWPGQDALGKRMRIGREGGYLEVVGVVKDGKYRTLGEENRPYAYRSLTQTPEGDSTLIARVNGDPGQVLAAIRNHARQIDEKVPDLGLTTVEEAIGVSLIFPRAGAAVFGLFGVLGLVLASLGLYGVIAYVVSQRTHEIGVRMALGAQRRDIFQMIVGQGLKLTGIGVALGLTGAFFGTKMLSVMLYGISPTDALTFTLVPLALVLVAAVACFIPARRAAAVAPMVALRYE